MLNWRGMRTMVVGLGLALVCGLVAPSPSRAFPPQASPPPVRAKVLWSKERSFRIPVTVPTKNRNLVRTLILFVSDDAGNVWKKYGTTTPDKPQFAFRAPRDGEYWFAVQTLDVDGHYYPSDDRPAEPTLKVIVDSVPPSILLEPKSRRGSDAGVRWEVQDDNLLLRTLSLEYQWQGARDWRQVPLDPSERLLLGIKTWDAGTADVVRVRMTVSDKAGNSRTVEQILPDGLAANPGPAFTDTRPAAAPPRVAPIANRAAPSPSADDDPFAAAEAASTPANSNPNIGSRTPAADPAGDHEFDAPPSASPAPRTNAPGGSAGPTLLVDSPRFSLKYEVEDAGPGGPAVVVLWTTRDGGRTWNRQAEDADRTSPYNVDLGGEGTFGLWLEVQSSSGQGDPPPAPGDRPLSWVEVDSTAPIVSLARPKVGTGANASKVILTWRAGDAHLAARPISLYYRLDRPESPWVPIADRLDNTGKFIWDVPSTMPARFHVKVEALDTLGNRGSADTTQDLGPVLLDRARPKGRIIGLDQPGGTTRQ
ncbi:MAG: hypothetical protein JWN86_3506 [Planctomycetota bacterium]|nr:hypothetical protein [Planctomycetota bacterium]